MSAKTFKVFLDLVLAIACIFIVMFIITEVNKKNEMPAIADLSVRIEWVGTSNNDIDLWGRNPEQTLCGYLVRNAGFMLLDGDDVGTDEFDKDGEPLLYNFEQMKVKQFMDGVYDFNLKGFRVYDTDVEKVQVSIFDSKGKQLLRKVYKVPHRQEVTICNVHVKDGKVTKVTHNEVKFFSEAE